MKIAFSVCPIVKLKTQQFYQKFCISFSLMNYALQPKETVHHSVQTDLKMPPEFKKSNKNNLGVYISNLLQGPKHKKTKQNIPYKLNIKSSNKQSSFIYSSKKKTCCLTTVTLWILPYHNTTVTLQTL